MIVYKEKNMKGLKYFVSFVIGAGIGAGITYKVFEKKFEDKAQKEIESVRELYLNREPAHEVIPEEEKSIQAEKAKNKPDILEYATELAQKEGYVNYAESSTPVKKKKSKKEMSES